MSCGSPLSQPTEEPTIDPVFEGREERYQPPETAQRTLRAEYELVTPGVAFATSLSAAEDGRVFIGEFRTGEVKQVLPAHEGGDGVLESFAAVPLPEHMLDEQGLWNVQVHPSQSHVYVSAIAETDPEEEGRGTWRVVRFAILPDGTAGPMEEVCTDLPAAIWHNGGGMVFDSDGIMYLSIGDVLDTNRLTLLRNSLASEPETVLDHISDLSGAILRVDPEDCNPTLERTVLGELLYAVGFRNPYGLALGPDGTLFATENGPFCCDQVLRVEPGSNRGWPQYGLSPEDLEDMQADETVLTPLASSGTQTIAPTEIVYYDGALYEGLTNSLIFGTFHAASLMRLELSPDLRSAIFEEVLLTLPAQDRSEYPDEGGIVGVTVGRDGSLYFASLEALYRLTDIGPIVE